MDLADGERVRVISRRGSIEAPVRLDPSLRPGLTFMTLHFQDDVQTNILTIDATDPEVRHGRVQGHRHPHREARLGSSRLIRPAPPVRREATRRA